MPAPRPNPIDLTRSHPNTLSSCEHRPPRPDQADGVARNLSGAILSRIEAKGYTLAELKKVDASRELLEQHYEEHVGKPFYEPLVEFMLSGPVVAAIFEGHRVIEGFRTLAGTTDPTTAAPDTIRGDFGRHWGLKVQQNLVHGSDSAESAEREIKTGSRPGSGTPSAPGTVKANVRTRSLAFVAPARSGTSRRRGSLPAPGLPEPVPSQRLARRTRFEN